MKDILSEIIAHKRIEIEQQKQAVSLSQLQEQAAAMMQEAVETGASGTTPVRSMKRALANSSSGIIAVALYHAFQGLDQGKCTGRPHPSCL